MREIPLTQGKVALVDDEDYERVAQFKWYAAKTPKTWYAQRMTRLSEGSRRTVQLHRWLMGEPKGREVDHENGDGLDCQQRNLRVCTHDQNQQNTGPRANNSSGFKGVYFQSGKWRARLGQGPRDARNRISLGLFDTAEEAAMAYDRAAVQHHGRFARLNLPERFTTFYEAGDEETV